MQISCMQKIKWVMWHCQYQRGFFLVLVDSWKWSECVACKTYVFSLLFSSNRWVSRTWVCCSFSCLSGTNYYYGFVVSSQWWWPGLVFKLFAERKQFAWLKGTTSHISLCWGLSVSSLSMILYRTAPWCSLIILPSLGFQSLPCGWNLSYLPHKAEHLQPSGLMNYYTPSCLVGH